MDWILFQVKTCREHIHHILKYAYNFTDPFSWCCVFVFFFSLFVYSISKKGFSIIFSYSKQQQQKNWNEMNGLAKQLYSINAIMRGDFLSPILLLRMLVRFPELLSTWVFFLTSLLRLHTFPHDMHWMGLILIHSFIRNRATFSWICIHTKRWHFVGFFSYCNFISNLLNII